MKRSNRLILLIGVFLAIVAFVLVLLSMGNNNSNQPPTPTTAKTVIAAADIPLGTKITAEMLTTQDLAITARNPGVFEDTGQVIGQIARTEITSGAQISERDFNAQTTSSVTDLIPPTNRAIAVQVDQVTGVGTLIQPGDHVDMVVGFASDKFPVISVDPSQQGGSGVTAVSGLNNTSVKLLLSGMQVLGTLLPPPTTVEGQAPAEGGETPATLTGQQEIVLLSVNAQQAEVIKFAQLDGSITLILRSPDDFVDPETGEPIEPIPPETSGVTLKVLVDEYDVLVPQLVETLLPAVGR